MLWNRRKITRMLLVLFVSLSIVLCSSIELSYAYQKSSPADNQGPVAGLETFFQVVSDVRQAHFYFGFINQNDEIKSIPFPSSHPYEIIITDQNGKEVSRLSPSNNLTYAHISKKINPKESIKWKETWDFHDMEGNRLPSGLYKAKLKIPLARHEQISEHIVEMIDVEIPPEIYENNVFRNVHVSGRGGKYQISGKVSTAFSNYGYSLDEGHTEYKKMWLPIRRSKQEWVSFQFQLNIEKEQLPHSGMLNLLLFVDDENYTNALYIPLEYFSH
jgi:hypothetical protein